MGLERIYTGELLSPGEYIQGFGDIGVDSGEVERAEQGLSKEEGLRETCRKLRQEAIKLGSLPLVIDNLTRHQDQEGLNRMIFEQLNSLPVMGFQVYESMVTERDLVEREEKNNRITAFLRRKSSTKNRPKIEDFDLESRIVLYKLVIFTRNRLNPMELELNGVEVRAELTPTLPLSHKLITSKQYYRWRGLKMLLDEVGGVVRPLTSRLEAILVWREAGRIPSIPVLGNTVTDLRLMEAPRAERQKLSIVELRSRFAQLSNLSNRFEKEVNTVLEDSVLGQSTWETQIYAVWSTPAHLLFNFVVFIIRKGGIFYQCSADVGLIRDDSSLSSVLDEKHVDILKILCLRKLRDTFQELDLRLELPGGRDPDKVPLPLVVKAATSPPITQPYEQTSLLGWFSKGKGKGVETVYRNNLNNEEPGPSPSLKPRLHRLQTLVDPETIFMPDIPKDTNKQMDSLKIPGDIPLMPERLQEQNYRKVSMNKESPFEKNPSESHVPLRRLSTYLEPHEPPGETLPAPHPVNPVQRPEYSRAPSINSTHSTETRRSSIILDMREAISESGKRLSSMVAENQSRALEALIADLNGRTLDGKRKMVYGLLVVCMLVAAAWLGLWLWEHLLFLRDGLLHQLQEQSVDQTLQLTELSARLEGMERLVADLHARDLSLHLDSVIGELRRGLAGNTLKVAVMDRLVEELTAIETALKTLQSEVHEGLSCGWNPFSTLLHPKP